MSLLMQALKKAEHAKCKQGNPFDVASNGTITLDPPNRPSEQIALSPQETSIGPIDSTAASVNENPFVARSAAALGMLDLELSPVIGQGIAPGEKEDESLSDQQFSPRTDPARAFAATEPLEQERSSLAPAAAESGGTLPGPRATQESAPEASQGHTTQSLAKARLEQQKSDAHVEKQTVLAQQKAKTVFASKQTPRKRKATIIALAGAIAVLALAGCGYYYLLSLTQGSALLLKPTPARSGPAPIPAETVPTTDAPAVPAEIAAPPEAAAGVPDSGAQRNAARAARVNTAQRPQQERPEQAFTAPAPAHNARRHAASAPAPRQDRSTMADDAKSIQIRQNQTERQLHPSLNNAYQLFMSGDAAAAQQQYQKVLQQEPNNRDALLGMAAIAISRKQATQASALYVKLLELDPADPDAIAGLTSLQAGDLSQNESRLKKILAQNPQSGAILFVLGNLYAQQARWPEAQQTYFRAFGTAPGNADYAFNLAVSLDRLNQGKLALDFYQRALTLVHTSPGNFNSAAVQQRVQDLQAAAQH